MNIEQYLPCLVLPAALVLDFLAGDPAWRHHPIRIMGTAIERMEPRFGNLRLPAVFSGGLFAVTLIGTTFIIALSAMWALWAFSPVLGFLMETVLVYFCLSVRELERSAMVVYQALVVKNIPEARKALSMIVGRDVAALDEDGITRATVETVAENLVDGVISPLFFAIIGGAPLALAYKMINTLDSMVGYKNEKYKDFGKVAARIDDAANFFPARLSVPVVSAAARLLAGTAASSYVTAREEGSHHASPNAGYPEAAFAGALRIRLGGPSHYQGKLVDKPCIGTRFSRPRPEHIRKACDLMVLSSLLGGVLFLVVGAIARGIM